VQKKFDKVDFIQIKQEFDTLIAKLNQRVNVSQQTSIQANDSP
jgi:hypothetical protein